MAAMKFADCREQVENRGSVFQLAVGMVLLAFVAAGGTMEGQSLQAVVAESQVPGAITQAPKGTGGFGAEIGPSNAHENSGLAEGEADRAAIISLEESCAMKISALGVDGCPMTASRTDSSGTQELLPESFGPKPPLAAMDDSPRENVKAAAVEPSHTSKPDFNRNIYYKNKLELSFETGWHPVNIPFVYDFAVGDSYNTTSLKYTLVPIIASLRWHVNDIGGPWIFRGNFDFAFSGSVTLIPRGPETHYFAFIFGIRRNFVHRNWRIVPYFDEQGGIGNIDAKEPLGVLYGQGQNLTFTYNMGTGIRYNPDARYSISAGMNYMHISNGYLSEPKFVNYGINVYGPMLGIDVRLGKPRHYGSE